MSKLEQCHIDQKTGLMWCKHPNGSWAPPFQVSKKDSSDETQNLVVNDDDDETKKTA